MINAPLYLVDDDEAVRKALTLLLETIGVQVQSFAEPLAFLDAQPSLQPGSIIMDIRMPMISGLKVQEKLNEAECDWPIIVISGHGDINACRQAFKNGAVDFLSKPVDEQDLIDAIQKAQAALSEQQSQSAELDECRKLLELLTPREREVVDMVARGWSTKEIAEAFAVSPRTIESHRAKIAEKLGTTSVAEMTRIVVESSLQPSP